jgi:polyhydroxybutyrate depolymerase
MGFVTLDPEGQGFPAYWDTRPGSPDLAFARRLLDDTERNLCIDRNRVYVDGYSNGAFLTSVLACTDANRIAAVATVAGMRNPPRCKPSRAVPVIGFHGTEDVYLPYAGGLSHKAADLPAADGSGRTIGQLPKGQGGALVPGSMNDSVPTILKAWARRNGCASALRSQAVTNDTTRLSFRCPKGHEVELYRSKGAGHDWPGSRVSAAIGGAIGPTTMSIDATDLMWAFFAAHPLTKH